jgi:GMP synthase-like glutamine amidotransferase
MKPVWIFRHVRHEGPGYLMEVLARHEVRTRIIAIDQGQAVPADPQAASALVFMGGYMSVNDPLPWILQELELIRNAARSGTPMLGHCLGGQLICKALGGQVAPSPVKEIGWLPVERIDSTAALDWLDGLPPRFEAFHWHGETFSTPDGATPILRSTHCPQQAFVRGNTLALQFHLEMTEPMVAQWAERHADELTEPTATVQSGEQMLADATHRVRALHTVADRLYERWLQSLA